MTERRRAASLQEIAGTPRTTVCCHCHANLSLPFIRFGAAPPSALNCRPTGKAYMNFNLECEREEDGRWLAEVIELPRALAYGSSANQAMAKAEVLALRVLAERLEHDEVDPIDINISIPAAA